MSKQVTTQEGTLGEAAVRKEWLWEWLFRGVLGLLICVLGFIGAELRGELSALRNSVVTISDVRLKNLEIWEAETKGNRFTSSDWMNSKGVIDQQIVALDRRILALENKMDAIATNAADAALASKSNSTAIKELREIMLGHNKILDAK